MKSLFDVASYFIVPGMKTLNEINSHQIKYLLRKNSIRGKGSIISPYVFIWMNVILTSALSLLAGKYLIRLSELLYPSPDPVEQLYSLVIYILALDIIIRWAFQKINGLYIYSYILFPVKRQRILNYIIIKSLINPVHFYTFICFVPLFCKMASSGCSGLEMTGFIAGIAMLLLLNNLVHLFMKLLVFRNIFFIIIPLTLIIILFVHSGTKELSVGLGTLLTGFHLVLYFVLFFLIASFWVGIYRLLNEYIYSESSYYSHFFTRVFNSGRLFNLTNVYIPLILKSILRNRILFQPLAGSFFYSIFLVIISRYLSLSAMYYLLFIGFGSWIISFSQFIPGVEGNYFPFINTRIFNWVEYLRSWYLLFVIQSLVNFVILLPGISLFHDVNLPVFAAIYLYTVGFGAFVLYCGMIFNHEKVNPTKMVFKWISKNRGGLMIIVFLITYSLPFFLNNILFLIIFFSTAGLFFMFSNRLWITWIAKKIINEKFKLIMNFQLSL